MREEQENQRIKDSVKLNLDDKSIMCTLPTRGSEQEFLSSNKDIAEKVLHSITKKYSNDENVKPVILAAFEKLIGKNFWRMEKLKGLKFHRHVMPHNAINDKMRLITAVDTALGCQIFRVWGGFKVEDASWSCKLVIGRGLLAPTENTIPKKVE